MDVEEIRPYVDLEFSAKKSSLAVGLLFRSLVSMFGLSLIDLISDVASTLQVSTDDCISDIFVADDNSDLLRVYIALLWVSTLSALINTICLKYLYALKMAKKHNLSFWNGMKYVAVVTFLKNSINYSGCCNLHSLLRTFVAILEDGIQFGVGWRILAALRRPDTTISFSLWTSALYLLWVFVTVLLFPIADLVRCCFKDKGSDWKRGSRRCKALYRWSR